MENSKNNYIIIGLALVFLFLSACGKKDNNNDDLLLSESNNVKTVKTSSATEKITDNNYSSETVTEDESLRPVIVTVLEKGSPSQGALASVNNCAEQPTIWSAKTDKKGIAKILIPAKQDPFRVTAMKDNFAMVSYKTNRLIAGATPIYVELNLNEQGIIITANLIADKEIYENETSARIIPANDAGWKSVNATILCKCENNKIIFPPIKKGLRKLRIKVKTKGLAEAFSDYFDTTDGENKIVDVKFLTGVKLDGKIVESDGQIITNFFLKATPCGEFQKNGQPGHFNENITTDIDGNFQINELLPEHYTFTLKASGYESITTNVVLYSDENNYIEFILPKTKYQTLKGVVVYEQSGEPAEGIEVICKKWINHHYEIIKTTTDALGQFNFYNFIKYKGYGRVVVNEQGFAHVDMELVQYDGHLIEIELKECGILTGKITTKDGKPVQGVKVVILPGCYDNKSSSSTLSGNNFYSEKLSSYKVESKRSDNNGVYVISNAAASLTYMVGLWGSENYYNENYKTKVKIKFGKTTIRNFTMLTKPTMLLKIIDEEGSPITSYNITIKRKYEHGSIGSIRNIDLANENDWYRVSARPKNNQVKIHLIVKIDSSDKCAELKETVIESGKTYKIILTLSNSIPQNISGFIYNENMDPCVNLTVWARSNGERETAKSDYLGFFEMSKMNIEKGANIRLSISYNYIGFTTNVCAGDVIEWLLPEPKKIVGRVFVNNVYEPATNYSVKIKSKTLKFKNENFSMPVSVDDLKEKIILKFLVPNYIPEIREVKWDTDSDIIDIGDVIIFDKSAEIIGTVIDYDGYPLSANISLTRIKGTAKRNILNSGNNEFNGNFEFTGLPPGTYQVSAQTRVGSTSSEEFELQAGETCILPDLIIVETNAPDVLFEFILSDGSPAGNAQISYFNKSADEKGFIREKMRPGIYDKWRVNIDDDLYNTEKFKIDVYTEKITLVLIHVPSITGTVTLDGKPLDNAYLNFQGDKNHYSIRAYNGKFELKAKPGKYIVTCRKKKVAVVVELSGSKENKINFKSGTAAFEFEFSTAGDWNITLLTKIDNKNINIASYNSKNDSGNKITKLHAGEYQIHANSFSNNRYTNISIKATLKSGETKEIKF